MPRGAVSCKPKSCDITPERGDLQRKRKTSMLAGMATISRPAKTLAFLLTGAALTACVGPRKEAVPYMSSEGVANAAYTANYNGNASASGKLRAKPVPETEKTDEAKGAADDGAAEVSER